MLFPDEFIDVPNDTTVIGDLDAFMHYLENGQALQDWYVLRQTAGKELEWFLQSRHHTWRHIVSQGSGRTRQADGS